MTAPPIGIFAMRDKKQHAARRALFRHAFSQSAVNDTEPVIAGLIQKLLSIVTAAKGDPVDMLKCFRSLTLDVVGQLFMGQSFEALDGEKSPEFLEWMDNMFVNFGINYAFPSVSTVMRRIPVKGVQDMVLAADRIADYGAKAFYRYIDENGRRPNRRDLLTKILRVNDDIKSGSVGEGEETQTVLSDRVIYNEVGNLIFAGTGALPNPKLPLFAFVLRV